MKRFWIFLFFILVVSSSLFAQVEDTVSVEEQAESNLEDVLEDSFTEESESDFFNTFEDLLLNPINLNTANINELTSIPFIDFNIADIIISHRKKYGKFISTSELYAIAQLNEDLIRKIIPFLKVDSKIVDEIQQDVQIKENWLSYNLRQTNVQLRSRIGSDLQDRQGFIQGKYLGSKIKSYNRILLKHSNKLQAGLTTEKDPGEKDFTDFYSFHLSFKNYGLLKELIIGDYNIEIAQGLLLWSSYSFSKGSDAILPIKKKSRNIRPYTGSSEYGFLRGAGVNVNYENFNLIFFYSSKKIDANIDTATQEIKSLPLTGIHATENELSRKNSAREILFGSRLEYSLTQSHKFGFTFYKTNFSNAFQKISIYDLSGKEFSFFSFDFDNRIGPINIFGEIANDFNTSAFYGGMRISPHSRLQIATSLRYYPKDFKNLHAYGFGEQSGKTQNEFGVYSGIKFNSDFGLFNIYYDKFKFPYATYENSVPSAGDEFYFSYRRKINRDLEIHLRYKTENKELTESINNLKNIVERIRNSYRAEFDYYVSKNFKLRTRVEFNTYSIDKINLFQKGFLIYEDIKISPMKDLTIYGRIILFETDSFNSAVYEFENDLTGLFTNLAMYNLGIRYYLIIKYKLLRNLSLSMKYAETYKPNERFLSSGNNKIFGNVDNRFTFQIDLKL